METEALPESPKLSARSIIKEIEKLTGKLYKPPIMVVCGAQGSGKSTVLKALTEFEFPIHRDSLSSFSMTDMNPASTATQSTCDDGSKTPATDDSTNLTDSVLPLATDAGSFNNFQNCTRFPIEIAMRYSSSESLRVKMVSGTDRTTQEKSRLARQEDSISSAALTISDLGQVIRDAQPMICGFMRPGEVLSDDVLHIETRGPGHSDITVVDLPAFDDPRLDRWLLDENAVILFVKDAAANPNGHVESFIRKYHTTARMITVFTKPDKINTPQDMRTTCMAIRDLTPNSCHVICIREGEDDDELFFHTEEAWSQIPREQRGVAALSTRVDEILQERVLEIKNAFIDEAKSAAAEHHKSLDLLGRSPRLHVSQKREFLMDVSEQFSVIIKDALGGRYSSSVFHKDKKQARLRNVIDVQIRMFEDAMHAAGRAEAMSDKEVLIQGHSQVRFPAEKLTIDDLYATRSVTWAGIATHMIRSIFHHVEGFIYATMMHILPCGLVSLGLIRNSTAKLSKDVHDVAEKLFATRFSRTTLLRITGKVKDEIRQKVANGLRDNFSGATRDNRPDIYSALGDGLLQLPDEGPEMEDDREASLIAEKYYAVMLERFIDNIIDQVVEHIIIARLPGIFAPLTVSKLDDDTVEKGVLETPEIAMRREEHLRRLKILSRLIVSLEGCIQNDHERGVTAITGIIWEKLGTTTSCDTQRTSSDMAIARWRDKLGEQGDSTTTPTNIEVSSEKHDDEAKFDEERERVAWRELGLVKNQLEDAEKRMTDMLTDLDLAETNLEIYRQEHHQKLVAVDKLRCRLQNKDAQRRELRDATKYVQGLIEKEKAKTNRSLKALADIKATEGEVASKAKKRNDIRDEIAFEMSLRTARAQRFKR